jgi:predicted transposase YbfD/YdcC
LRLLHHNRLSLGAYAIIIAVAVSNASRSAETQQNISSEVPMYCLDSTGTYQPLVRTNYGRLIDAFQQQFGWEHSLFSTDSSKGYLVFSRNGKKTAPEKIIYDVRSYNDGIALERMHVRMTGKNENNGGTQMCGITWSIVNTP